MKTKPFSPGQKESLAKTPNDESTLFTHPGTPCSEEFKIPSIKGAASAHQVNWTDKTTSLLYLRKMGGTNPSLQIANNPLLRFILRHRISFTTAHFPGILNTEADCLSRSRSRDHDYHLDPSFFRSIENATTTPSTSRSIEICSRAESTPNSEILLSSHRPQGEIQRRLLNRLVRDHCFAFPPIPRIPKVLSHFTTSPYHTMMTMVVPIWLSSSWWPTLLQLSTKPPTPFHIT